MTRNSVSAWGMVIYLVSPIHGTHFLMPKRAVGAAAPLGRIFDLAEHWRRRGGVAEFGPCSQAPEVA